MGNYYLDIETTGLDEVQNEIVTIQWCELERNTGQKLGELQILKSWESSEKDILEKFADIVDLTNPYPFSFIRCSKLFPGPSDNAPRTSSNNPTQPVIFFCPNWAGVCLSQNF